MKGKWKLDFSTEERYKVSLRPLRPSFPPRSPIPLKRCSAMQSMRCGRRVALICSACAMGCRMRLWHLGVKL